MSADPVSQTARWTAAARAREHQRPDRLFEDPFAERLATPLGFKLLERLGFGGENPYIVVRTRFLDDFLRCEIPSQVVLVAAGLDARAYRLDWATGVVLFELDRPELLADKNARMADAVPRCDRRPVAVDLGAAWEDPLRHAGFDPLAPSAWVVEGLLVYLEAHAVRDLLGRIGRLAARGSRIALDVPSAGLLTSSFTAEARARVAEIGAPWKFGTDEPERFVSDAGWVDAIAVRPGDPEAHYGRWPWPIAPRDSSALQNFFVTASAPETSSRR